MNLLWKIALAWGLLSGVSLTVLLLAPTTAAGDVCGPLYNAPTFLSDACTDLRALLFLPALAAGLNTALGLLVAFFAYAHVTAPRPAPRQQHVAWASATRP